jgi:GNAT superfamily N-acetyltransferase
MLVRKPQPAEFEFSVNLYGQWFDEYSEIKEIDAYSYEVNSVIEYIRRLLVRTDACWFVLFDNTRPVGFISLVVGTDSWNDEQLKTLICDFWIMPSYRTTDNMNLLLDKAIEWHRSIKATKMFVEFDVKAITDIDNFFKNKNFNEVTLLMKEVI